MNGWMNNGLHVFVESYLRYERRRHLRARTMDGKMCHGASHGMGGVVNTPSVSLVSYAYGRNATLKMQLPLYGKESTAGALAAMTV